MSKKTNTILIIAIITVGLLVTGGTYAFLTFGNTNVDGQHNGMLACFIMDYDYTNDDGTMTLGGTLFQSSVPKTGLSGKVSFGIKNNCDVSALGKIKLTVNSGTSEVLYQVVTSHCRDAVTYEKKSQYTSATTCNNAGYEWVYKAHCEDPATLKTLKEYTTDTTCEADGYVWLTSSYALKYAVYKNINSDPVSVGYIDGVKEITLYDNIRLTHYATPYYVYIWLDGELADNQYLGVSFDGDIHLEADQTE